MRFGKRLFRRRTAIPTTWPPAPSSLPQSTHSEAPSASRMAMCTATRAPPLPLDVTTFATHSDDHSCAICLARIRSGMHVATGNCLHQQHATCMTTYLQNLPLAPCCPVCRLAFTPVTPVPSRASLPAAMPEMRVRVRRSSRHPCARQACWRRGALPPWPLDSHATTTRTCCHGAFLPRRRQHAANGGPSLAVRQWLDAIESG